MSPPTKNLEPSGGRRNMYVYILFFSKAQPSPRVVKTQPSALNCKNREINSPSGKLHRRSPLRQRKPSHNRLIETFKLRGNVMQAIVRRRNRALTVLRKDEGKLRDGLAKTRWIPLQRGGVIARVVVGPAHLYSRRLY